MHGDTDEHVPPDAVQKLAQKLDGQKNISVDFSLIKGADHFYQDRFEPLTTEVGTYLDKYLSPEPEEPAKVKKRTRK